MPPAATSRLAKLASGCAGIPCVWRGAKPGGRKLITAYICNLLDPAGRTPDGRRPFVFRDGDRWRGESERATSRACGRDAIEGRTNSRPGGAAFPRGDGARPAGLCAHATYRARRHLPAGDRAYVIRIRSMTAIVHAYVRVDLASSSSVYAVYM